MKQAGGGAIINIGSIAGKVTLPWLTLYSATKYCLGSLSEGLRMELKQDGIHVMIVCPGYILTRFQRNALAGSPPDLVGRGKRWAISPEDCARDIARGLERDAPTVVTPRSGWAFIAAQRMFPRLVESRLEKIYRKQETRS
jgi:short-subunit dehydrogenase